MAPYQFQIVIKINFIFRKYFNLIYKYKYIIFNSIFFYLFNYLLSYCINYIGQAYLSIEQ